MMEKFNQMMATGEFFDVMFPGGTSSYSGGYQQGIEDGVLIDMDPYVSKEIYAKLYGLAESNPEAKNRLPMTTASCTVRVLRGTDENLKVPGALPGPRHIRADLLEKNGRGRS